MPSSKVVPCPSVALGTPYCVILIEKLHNVVMHAFLSNVPRQPVHVVCNLSVGKVRQQHPHSFTAALTGCKEQRGLLLKRVNNSVLDTYTSSLLTQSLVKNSLNGFSTFRSCMSLFAPFFSRAIVASTLLTAAAQCKADLPKKYDKPNHWLHCFITRKQKHLH